MFEVLLRGDRGYKGEVVKLQIHKLIISYLILG